MESYIVVGAGLAGLTAANALAEQGRRVTVLEQSERLGGRAMSQQDRGYSLNLGPHALYCGGRATKTFQEWNIPVHGKRPLLDRDSYLVRGNQTYPFINNTAGLFTTRMFGFTEKLKAAHLLRMMTAGRAPAGVSMSQWLDQHSGTERVREFGAAIVRVSTYAADLAHLSAQAALDQIASAFKHGVLYVDGGWRTLVDGLAARARSLGVEIRCGQPVGSLEDLGASGVVLATPPATVANITGVRFPNLRPVRAACLDLCLRKWPEGGARFALGLDQPLYFSVHSAVAKVAPDGAALVHAGKYLDEEESDPKADRAELEQLADLVMAGWRDQAELVRFLPNLTVTHAMPGLNGRPDVDALGIDGVAIAGDWVGPAGMLADAAVASGLRAAHLIQRSQVLATAETAC